MARKLAITFYILIAAVPVLGGFIYALLYSLGLTGLLNTGFTLDYWSKTIESFLFWKSLGYSIYIAITVLLISISLALWIVISWLQDLYKGFLSYIIYLPLAFPGIVMSFLTLQMLSKSGFLSRLFYAVGLINAIDQFPDWTNDAFGVGIVFSLCLMITPFFIILFSTIYKNEAIGSLAKLAATLGATRPQIIRKVVVPVLLKKSTFTIILFGIFIMGTYEVPLLLGRQDPSMLSILIIQKLQKFNLADIPQAYAIAVIYMVMITTVIVILFQWKPQFFGNTNRS